MGGAARCRRSVDVVGRQSIAAQMAAGRPYACRVCGEPTVYCARWSDKRAVPLCKRDCKGKGGKRWAIHKKRRTSAAGCAYC